MRFAFSFVLGALQAITGGGGGGGTAGQVNGSSAPQSGLTVVVLAF